MAGRNVASGDRDRADASLQTFHSHFPRGGAVDEGFNVSAANMSHARVAVGWQLLPAVGGELALNTQWRTSRRDALDVGAGYFFSGRFVAQSGLDRDMAYLTPTFRLRP